MFKISLVDAPAVMSDFQAFDAERKPMLYAISDEEKRLVRGCIMRADFPIYRIDPKMGEFYIIYKADTIRQMAEKYLLEGRQNSVNLMHEEGSDVEGVQMVQYFIKGDGVSVEGFDECADGSLFGEFHILNDEVWAQVKAGTYKGFSLEGVFDLVPEQDRDEIQEIVDVLATDRGVLSWDGDEDLKEGDSVYVEDTEGNRTPAEDGDYKTEDNKVIVVVDGKVSEIKDAEAEVAPEAEPETEANFGAVNTDKGVLQWEGEEDLKEGDAVFVERDGERVPAEDGEYVTEDGKTIVVAEGRVAEIRDAEAEVAPEGNDEVEALRAENAALKEQNASLEAELDAKSQESIEKRLREAQIHQEYQKAKALLDRIPKDILDQAKWESRQAGKQRESR